MAVLIWVLPLLVTSSLATSPPAHPPPTPPTEPPIITPTVTPPLDSLCVDNARYVRNSTACRLTCANRLVQTPCGTCKPYTGCVCKPGFVRLNDDATGPCVTTAQCPPSCPKGEHYEKDSNSCEKTCANRDSIHLAGACLPSSKCFCNGDLMRLYDDATGPCVSEDQCPDIPPRCPPGEHYVNNTVQCEKTCDNRKIYHIMGPCQPFSKCICNVGLIRLKNNGPCAPEDQCPPSDISCGKNEEWTPDKKTCPPETCQNLNTPVPCAPPPEFWEPKPGCKCRDGYLRDTNDICVPIEDCPPPCPVGEHLVKNTNQCEKTCDNRKIYHIMGPCAPFSKCVCDRGLIRLSRNGPCAPEDQCPPSDISCGKNEEWTPSKSPCPRETCDTLYFRSTCPPIPEHYIKPGCKCRFGHLRDLNNKCIPVEECPPLPGTCKGPNEVYEDEIKCPPQTCASIYTTYSCLPNREAGCNCINGYLRNDNGTCVRSEDCPGSVMQCGENEIYTDRKFTCPPQSCVAASGLIQYLCAAEEPKPGCICKQNYYRNADDICIPKEECPPGPEIEILCGPNEVKTDKKVTCPPETCEAKGRKYKCPAQKPMKGCKCKKGYLRNAKGQCIPECECDKIPKQCKINESCRRTCANRDNPECVPRPAPDRNVDGCECKPGYILKDVNGKCIPENQCPQPTCPANEVFSRCKVECPLHYCPVTDIVLQGILICDPPQNCPSGCTCQQGFLRKSYEEPICVDASTCPPVNCTRPNEVWYPAPETCLAQTERCENLVNPKPCLSAAKNFIPRCTCKEGYYKNASNICVRPEQCPGYKPCGPNSIFKKCPNACPGTCEQPNPSGVCTKLCLEQGCECNPGYVLHEGNCIKPKDCPKPCGPNSTYKKCPNPCPGTCEQPTPSGVCSKMCLAQGCECNPGYVLHEGNCIKPKDCPQQCGPNSTFKKCPNPCPGTCKLPNSGVCNKECIVQGCECNPGFVLHEGKCIEWKDCPPVPCPANQTHVYCAAGCPTDYCPSSDTRAMVACMPPYPCPPGCVCQAGYKKKSRDDPGCIKSSDCPPVKCTRPNEVWNPSPPNCIEDKCTDLANPQPCNRPYPNYTPQCVCREGYYRNKADICVPARECEHIKTCGVNETLADCGVECNGYCPTTDSQALIACSIAYPCHPGCICKPGYKRKSYNERICIKSSECAPVKCTRPNEEWNPDPPYCLQDHCGDVLYPRPCPPPSSWPDSNDPKCVCKQGYYRNDSNICVPVMECGIKCPANQTFVYCNVGCPTDNCPVNDDRAIIACDPPYPCPHGCACAAGYKRISDTDRTCIKASECPPVTCTRPNEVWNPTPPNCIRESCDDYSNPRPCEWNYPNYTPQCMCREGYYRNQDEICVPASQCPVKCPVPASCRPTCAVPNPKNCPASPPATANVDGCQCKTGYVLSAEGKCIRIEECPQDVGCNGDPHAKIMACPWSSPATCNSPQASNGDKKCEPVGCVCQDGYILSKKDGKCILPDKCSGGDPCGPNGTFVDCGFRCPNQYCPKDDSGIIYACKPGRPCPPGCACKINHLRNNKDDRCILASECPPVKCTRPNEVWNSCPLDCASDLCESVNDPPAVCNTLLLNCQPKCVCKDGHFRNSSKICVPAQECPIPESACGDCAPTCAVPNPPNCPLYSDLKKPCCEHGYILSEKGGKCIRIEDCPKKGCNGDPNAVVRGCPAPCVRSTCSKPEAQFCPTACNPTCECAPGYILSDKTRKCIKINECPGGNPCGKNAIFVNCKSECPTNYCPVDDSRATIICETPPFAPCVSGCVCNLNHKWNNRKEKKCIVSSDCPPVKCTRPNEEWKSCPSECQSEYCDAADEEPVQCNPLVLNCQPRCGCKEGYFRNATDICICRDECPEEECE